MKMNRPFALIALVLALSAGVALAEEIAIQVAPNIVNIGSQGTIFTVHTDIPYSAVVGSSVFLNDIAIDWWKSDDRGYFVAKFVLADVKGILTPGMASVVTLTGETIYGTTFSGSAELLAIQPTSKR